MLSAQNWEFDQVSDGGCERNLEPEDKGYINSDIRMLCQL